MKPPYPTITKLNIPVYSEPVAHVFYPDIEKVLTEIQLDMFNRYFGDGQTCPEIGNGEIPAMYPWDVEAVLVRMFSGQRQGTQLFWD